MQVAGAQVALAGGGGVPSPVAQVAQVAVAVVLWSDWS